MKARVSHAVAAILDAALRGELTETQAQQLYAYGPEAVTLVLLTLTRHRDKGDITDYSRRRAAYGGGFSRNGDRWLASVREATGK